ncbi:SRPBCC family protein [Rhizobium leguminosarum]|uniref:SRPBCC family protein n=1 Tax=Rhizobium leguminosarum TaxID=384 RepID=UPI00143F0D14|nr:SRPBCC family protein [Rhizobium leguminosarum]NKL23902.1 SRPBCC family protein [Rhizobium leguminosarum bv. viciae]
MSDSQASMSPAPLAPDFMVIISKIEISKPADEAWSTIGTYGDAGKYLNVDSEQISGDGGIGSVRTIGNSIVEVMVGKGPRSYTYTQTTGPMAPFSYHGSVALEDAGERSSTLIYTINYDQTTMDAAAREAAVGRIRPRFQGMIEAMKSAAEATTPS